MKKLKIDTVEKFIDLYEKLDDENFLNSIELEPCDLSFSLKLEGKEYSSSLKGSMILALAKYQQSVYNIYKVQKYGKNSNKKLTDKEKELLEIKVSVKQGCTETIVSIAKEAFSHMEGNQILFFAGIVGIVYLIANLGNTILKGHFKTKQDKISNELKQAESEERKQVLSTIENISKYSLDSAKAVVNGLISSNADKVFINNKETSFENLQKYAEELKVPEPKKNDDLPDFYLVKGKFKVLKIDYQHTVTFMSALHIDSNTEYDNISLQDDWITPENLQLIKQAQSREPISFTIICQKDGRKYNYTIDINSINKE